MNAEIIQHMERPHMMQQHLADFLQRQVPGATHETAWDDGHLPLYVTSYLSDELPPLDMITSVRALVFREGEVLVVRDPGNVHITPGGRREADETLLETLRREVLEETGWHLENTITQLGFFHFHNLNPSHPFARPDFLQMIYTAQASHYEAGAKEVNGYELGSEFRPLAEVQQLPLSEGERLFLRAALAQR